MTRTGWTLVTVAGVLVVAAIILEIVTAPASTVPEEPSPLIQPEDVTPVISGPEEAEAEAGSLRIQEIELYFLRPDGRALAPEVHEIFETTALLGRLKQSVVGLIRGPSRDSVLLPVLPSTTSLRDLYLNDGTAYVNLGQEIVRQLEPGSASELFAVVSLANTLALNFPSVQRVKILVEGEEVNTLGGHLDLTNPILPDPSLVKPLVETDFLDTFRTH